MTNCTSTASGSLPNAGYVIRPNYTAVAQNSVKLIGNYFGMSNDGIALVVGDDTAHPNSTAVFKELLVAHNIFESNTYYASLNYNTGKPTATLARIAGAQFIGNIFVSKYAPDATGMIRATACSDVIWANNRHLPSTGGHALQGLVLDALCARWSILGNEFALPGDAKSRGIVLLGHSHTVTGNMFKGDSQSLFFRNASKLTVTGNCAPDLSTQSFVDWEISIAMDSIFANNYGESHVIVKNGNFAMMSAWNHYTIVANTELSATLPEATVGQRYTLLRHNGSLTITPQNSDIIRGGKVGQSLRLAGSDGDSVTLECVVARTWEIAATRGSLNYL